MQTHRSGGCSRDTATPRLAYVADLSSAVDCELRRRGRDRRPAACATGPRQRRGTSPSSTRFPARAYAPPQPSTRASAIASAPRNECLAKLNSSRLQKLIRSVVQSTDRPSLRDVQADNKRETLPPTNTPRRH